MKKVLFFIVIMAAFTIPTIISPVFAQTPAAMGEITPHCGYDIPSRTLNARLIFKRVPGAATYELIIRNIATDHLTTLFSSSEFFGDQDDEYRFFAFTSNPSDPTSDLTKNFRATITPISTSGEKGQGYSINFTCAHFPIPTESEPTNVCDNKTVANQICIRAGFKRTTYTPDSCPAEEEPDPTCTTADAQPQDEGGGDEGTPPAPASNACTKPTGLRNDAAVQDPEGADWAKVTLHWDEQAGKKYSIQVKDSDDSSVAVSGPMGTVSCPHGGGDFCISNWESNQITISVRKSNLYLWTIKPEGCPGIAASEQFRVETAGGGDEGGQPAGGEDAPGGDTGGTPPPSGLRYTCTFSQRDADGEVRCYGGTGIGTDTNRPHNQNGCVYVGGPVLCPVQTGGNTGGSTPQTGGSQPAGSQSRATPVPTQYGGPNNYVCQENQVTLSARQDGTKVFFYVQASAQPREGTTNPQITIDKGVNPRNCIWKGESPGGSGIFLWECTGVDPAMAGQRINWTHTWQKGCRPDGRGGISCSGPTCSKPSSYQLEDTACDKSKVTLVPSINKTTGQITYAVTTTDTTQGTNTILDTFSPKPFVDNGGTCDDLTTAQYIPTPKPGKVCSLQTTLNPDTVYTWEHKWRVCRGSRGDNCSPDGLCATEVAYKIAADKTLTIVEHGPAASIVARAAAAVFQPTPTAIPSPTPCATHAPSPTTTSNRPLNLGVLHISPPPPCN